ncbi:MAG: alpha/beta hydrolase, partial [Clostridia bacterium]|nr:alpha/beta hydrolase [Clostridia bacterium]
YYQADAIMQKTMANLLSEDLRGKLALIKAEVLLIWGENDQMTPLHLGKEMAAKIPQAKLAIIKGARHVPQITNWQETMQVIANFLKEDNTKEKKTDG